MGNGTILPRRISIIVIRSLLIIVITLTVAEWEDGDGVLEIEGYPEDLAKAAIAAVLAFQKAA